MQKEIPILFSTPMVQAILEGRKTQTRRIMKIDEECDHSILKGTPHADTDSQWSIGYIENGFNYYNCAICGNGAQIEGKGYKCPYGQPGNILWVRETWQWIEGFAGSGYYVFKTDFLPRYGAWKRDCAGYIERIERWKPSIHMPKAAARIWLQVTDVRVERLQEIGEEDAKNEGVEKIDDSFFCWRHYGGKYAGCSDAKTAFQSLWQSINGDESWQATPWVWVVSFKILSTTGRPNV